MRFSDNFMLATSISLPLNLMAAYVCAMLVMTFVMDWLDNNDDPDGYV